VGIDWIRKAEERFKHELQESAHTDFKVAPLFAPQEEETVTYPCHWLSEDDTLPVGTRLTIFQRGERAHVAVMHASTAVAEVRGEAARDLKVSFREHAEWHNMLSVTIVRVSEVSQPFYVQIVSDARKHGRGTR
jgi:hypothetical protein